MNKMKAVVVTGQGQVEIRSDVPVPEIGDYEVLVQNHACGICSGTDFQIINGTLEEAAGFSGYPTVLGHEGSGEVIRLGSKVRHIQIGDRCIHANLRPEVGNCYHKTYGGMAQYGIGIDYQAMLEDGACTPDTLPFNGKFHLFPKEISFLDAALLLSLSECDSASRNFGVKKGDHVLFYGAGPMGTALALFMKLRGAERIVAIDGIDARLENARRIAHVDQTINFTKESADEVLNGEKFDLVVDAVGSSSIIMSGSYQLKPGGKVCSLGVLKKADREIPVSRLQNNTSLHMLNQPYGEYAIMDETIRLILDGKINPKDFYSHVVYFEDIDKALALVRNREAFKVVLDFEEKNEKNDRNEP